jgi:hypothetical protein
MESSVSAAELDVLRALKHGATSRNEIADRIGTSKACVSSRLSTLIREGYVHRVCTQIFELTGKSPKFVRIYKGNIKPIDGAEFETKPVFVPPITGTPSGFIAPIPMARLMGRRA